MTQMTNSQLNKRLAELLGIEVTSDPEWPGLIACWPDGTKQLWNPAENLEQCFDVVAAEMDKKGFWLDFDNLEKGEFKASFNERSGDINPGEYDPSPSRAICLAAIEALSDEQTKEV